MRSRELSYDFPVHEYLDLYSAEIEEAIMRYEEKEAKGEDVSELAQKIIELKEELRYYRAEIFSELLSDEIIAPIRVKLEEVTARDDDFDVEITNEHVRSYMLDAARRTGVKSVKEFNALDWGTIFFGDYDYGDEPAADEPAADEPASIVDSYDEISGTELVRTGDIIEVRRVDPSREGKINKVHSSEHSMGSEVIINTEAHSPDIIEDVAHHTELTETSIDDARDELFTKTGEDAGDEFSEEEKFSVSIDASTSVDRQQEDTCPNELSVQPSVQNEFTEFIFPLESHQYSHDIPVLEEISREYDE